MSLQLNETSRLQDGDIEAKGVNLCLNLESFESLDVLDGLHS